MLTLTKGYKKPQTPDTGDVFFPAMEQNIQQLNDHNHDGVNSQVLAVTSQNILSGAWVAAPIGGGLFRQTVTVPTGFSYDSVSMWFRLSTGEFVYPSIERISSSQYFIYTNNNALNYVAFYR